MLHATFFLDVILELVNNLTNHTNINQTHFQYTIFKTLNEIDIFDKIKGLILYICISRFCSLFIRDTILVSIILKNSCMHVYLWVYLTFHHNWFHLSECFNRMHVQVVWQYGFDCQSKYKCMIYCLDFNVKPKMTSISVLLIYYGKWMLFSASHERFMQTNVEQVFKKSHFY